MIFVLIDKQLSVNLFDFWADFVLIFKLEALDVVSNLALRVNNSEIILFDEIESQKWVFAVISLEAGNHILVFELYIRGVIVDDRKKWKFSWEKRDDVVICWWINILNFLLKAIFFKDNHLIFKDISVVLFQQLFVGEIDAKLLERIVSEILKTKDIEQVDGVQGFIGVGIQCYLYLVDDELEDWVVDGFAKSVSISNAAIFTVGFEEGLFLLEHSLLEEDQLL